MVKKLLFTLFSLFLAHQTYELLSTVTNSHPTTYEATEVIVISFLLNLFITGIFAFPGFVFQTSKLLGTKYYRIKNAQLLKTVYNVFQVDIFRKLLLFFFWGRGKNKTKYFNGTRQGLANFSYQSRQSEFGHLMALICVFAANCILLFYGHYEIVLASTIINLIGNLYPIILQRHHRIRIDQILNR